VGWRQRTTRIAIIPTTADQCVVAARLSDTTVVVAAVTGNAHGYAAHRRPGAQDETVPVSSVCTAQRL
jgi:hypothetical protein